jgi:glycosyltransferase involved in cell wall biosynthesis/lipopolysaccharide/colanic/teichoic acid biosynthesis glycosyltransferase
MSAPLRVTFAFASYGIGGAERSMLRLMAHAHPRVFACSVIERGPENQALREAVNALGIPFHALGPWDVRAWRRVLRHERPDVLYIFGRFRTVAWALEARAAGVRCIVAAERSTAGRRSDRWARQLDRHCVTSYVANTEFAARHLRSIVGAGGPPVHVVPNGIETDGAPPRMDWSYQTPSLLCVGNLSPNKGQAVLLEAVHLLRPRYPDLRATLLGRDFTGGRFFRDADARRLGDTYDAVGFVDDVRPHLAGATLVVLPTLHREGMPTSVLEAMRAGVPVVASDIGGVSEIVDDGRTGLLVRPGDPHALAVAIDRVLQDEALRTSLATRAREHAVARHDMSAMLEGHRAAFLQALARAGVRRNTEAAPASVVHVTTADISLRYLLLNQLQAIRDAGYDVTGISSPGPDVAALEAQGIAHEAVPMTRRLTPFADLRSLLRLTRVMRRRRFTIVHTHNPKPGLLGQLAARLAGVPIVVNTLHGFYFHDHMRPAARRFFVAMERLAARCSDLVLSQNEEDVATAIREGIIPAERIRLLGNGIDLRRFDPDRLNADSWMRTRSALGIDTEAPVVGFVGRLVAEKGIHELLAAARQVRDAMPSVRFLLVGGADTEKADHVTPDVARRFGLEEACIFAGQRQDMPELYQAMDVFVLPSHREGFPRAPMEASAMGVPCVVTDIRGCRQAVAHERNGLLVGVGDVDALASAIRRLLQEPARARRLGEEGRRRAREEFDEQRVFATVLAEYDRLLARHRRRQAAPGSALTRGLKNVLDRAGAAVGLIVGLPVLATLALIVRSTLGSPVFFRQSRPGLDGVPFEVIKFRTMRDGDGGDAERLTGFGRFLRSTSLDELPELWNVLRGEMSLVGPRPLLTQYLDRYTADQKRRHDVKPGMTGWAQVNGRNALEWDEKFALDLWYVDNWSLGLDLRILVRTVVAVLTRRGISARGSATMPEFQGTAETSATSREGFA